MTRSRILAALAMVTVLAAGIVALRIAPSSAESARVVAPPALDEPAGQAPTEVAVLAGGCFWGVQGVFEHVKGVKQVLSGYSGGTVKDPNYEMVSSGSTGHAESVQIKFDPSQVSYGTLLRVFFSVAHNPTELNYQINFVFDSEANRRLWAKSADHDVAWPKLSGLTKKALWRGYDLLSSAP